MPWVLVAASCIGMFAVTASGSSRAPFLIDMARDLDVGLPMIANLFGVTSVAWGVSSLLVGRASDIWGRRIFMVGGLFMLMVTLSGAAMANNIWVLAAWVGFAGFCSGAYTSSAMAEIAIQVVDRMRGRALGWVMAGQSLTLLIGVPLAAWLGDSIGWRGVHFSIGGLGLLAGIFMFFATMPTKSSSAAAPLAKVKAPPIRSAFTLPVIRILSSLVMERVSFGLCAFYYAAYLRVAHNLELAAIALPLVAFALGNIGGTISGGQLADRLANRRLTCALLLPLSGIAGFALFSWHPSLGVTVGLGFAFGFLNALSRPSLMAALAEVPSEVRGTVMGLNSSVASIGWLVAALVGGWMYAGAGFDGFGPLMLGLTIVGAVLVLPERKAATD
jgi:predicted MFS family arabinose efflux permease